MATVFAVAILLVVSPSPGAERVWGLQPPCHQCDSFRDPPLQEIRTHCTYPCECEEQVPLCAPGVSLTRDGCGCCPICARQLGEACDKTSICDERRGIYCHYPFVGATVGICQGVQGYACTVDNTTYRHGETFRVDCRTQCTCQNGTYACSSLCPNENISPLGACEHPRLVEVPDQCCREWMCDSREAEHPPSCKQEFTSWSDCSALCGLGLSHRVSNVNGCVLQNETRICQLRPCEVGMLAGDDRSKHHHIRKGHECKATQRVAGPVRLHFGPCRSRKRYRPKFCGHCADRQLDSCCSPQLSTTISVEFICDVLPGEDDSSALLLDLLEPGRDLWWPDDLLSLKLGTKFSEFNARAKDSFIFNYSTDRKRPFLVNSSQAFVGSSELDLVVDSEEPTVYLLGRHLVTTERANQKSTINSVTAVTPEMTVSPKPKKKKRRKSHKPYTSWLEFRDEEYEMDEYDDYEDNKERRKRSLNKNKKQKQTKRKRKRRHVSTSESKKDTIKLGIEGVKSSSVHQFAFSQFEQKNVKRDKIKKIAKFHADASQLEESHRARVKNHKNGRTKKKQKSNTSADVKHNGERTPQQIVNISYRTGVSLHEKQDQLSNTDLVSPLLTRKESSRPKVRKKRSLQRSNHLPSGGHIVSFNVEWIVKCACDRSCGITTTTPSEGEILLRRVHRTSPP